MSKARSFLKYWLPAILWMLVIFCASTDVGSLRQTSRIIGPLLHWLFPQMPEPTVGLIVLYVRKCAHLTEYAILALLFWRALRKPVKNDPRPWSWAEAGKSVLLVALYASSDEFHQLFVPSRQASVWDVMIDTTGGILGMLALAAVLKWRKRRRGQR